MNRPPAIPQHQRLFVAALPEEIVVAYQPLVGLLKLSLLFLKSYLLGRFNDVAFPHAQIQVEKVEGWYGEDGVVAYDLRELRCQEAGWGDGGLDQVISLVRSLSRRV